MIKLFILKLKCLIYDVLNDFVYLFSWVCLPKFDFYVLGTYKPCHYKTCFVYAAQLIRAYVFATKYNPYFLNLKFQASSYLLRLYSPVVSYSVVVCFNSTELMVYGLTRDHCLSQMLIGELIVIMKTRPYNIL